MDWSIWLEGCASLENWTCTGALTALQVLDLGGCGNLRAVPDLSNFHELEKLSLKGCSSLENLSCTKAVMALQVLDLVVVKA